MLYEDYDGVCGETVSVCESDFIIAIEKRAKKATFLFLVTRLEVLVVLVHYYYLVIAGIWRSQLGPRDT